MLFPVLPGFVGPGEQVREPLRRRPELPRRLVEQERRRNGPWRLAWFGFLVLGAFGAGLFHRSFACSIYA